MAEVKITELTELITTAGEDLLVIVDDPSGVPITKNVKLSNLLPDGIVTAGKLEDPYDIYSIFAAGGNQLLFVNDGYIDVLVPDVHNGKNVVKVVARVDTPSSSGDVTVRLYNETDSTVVTTVTVTAGSNVGSTTSITNPSLATNDILRIDVTGAGSGAKGLIVLVKVDKS